MEQFGLMSNLILLLHADGVQMLQQTVISLPTQSMLTKKLENLLEFMQVNLNGNQSLDLQQAAQISLQFQFGMLIMMEMPTLMTGQLIPLADGNIQQ